jgi:hypothetical protein
MEHAGRLVQLAIRTEERTWQGLAWEMQARVALSRGATEDAVAHIEQAFAATQHFQTPLADWRIHRTAARAYERRGEANTAALHVALGSAKKAALTASLPAGHRLRDTLEQAPSL